MTKMTIAVLLPLLAASCATVPAAEGIPRISPRDAHERMERQGALLVCAYRAEKCPGTHLAGAMSLEELETRLPVLGPDQEIIFFCGCLHEVTAAQRAVEMKARGFRNVGVVAGGFLAWILDGYDVTTTGKENLQ
ncbi:MAG TPA: rhodanese-like domain-containing protein [Planctomycetota bacterium]|jgi:rhodanese-related sulfurtransferase|nr:rhodanese-like domain-containing protein [Planctomycetota bacterium]